MSLIRRTTPAPDWIVARSRRDLRRLAAQIRWQLRDYPVLTLAGADGSDPSSLVVAMRKAIGSRLDIYLIVNDRLFGRFSELGGTVLSLNGRAGRIWWPEHPAGEREQASARIEQALDASRPGAQAQIQSLTREIDALRTARAQDQLEIRALDMAFWSALSECLAQAASLELIEALPPSMWKRCARSSSPQRSRASNGDGPG